jgi:tetratricopeptide (TPR) repeat protein
MEGPNDVDQTTQYFQNALESIEDNPGKLWVLFFEFRKIQQESWSEKCLINLEKLFLFSGAQSAPVISYQLLHIANEEMSNGNIELAEKYFAWSSEFEHYPLWQLLSRGINSLPKKPLEFFRIILSCLNLIKKSWLLQVSLLFYLYKWLYWTISVFVCMVIFIYSLETLPVSIHKITCFFPQSVPYYIRYILCILILISLVILGILPFLLLLIALIWSNTEKQKKKILLFVIFLLVISPFSARIYDIFRSTLSINETLGCFRRVIDEGYHLELEKEIYERIETSDNDYLLFTAAAINNLKKNDLKSAIHYISLAEKINRNDPAVMITAGNIHYVNNNEDKAIDYYSKCIEKYPLNEIALFNSGQINLTKMNTSAGSNQISKASDLNPDLINSFIGKNSTYFPDEWPPLRKCLQPDFHPLYFFRYVFPKYSGTWDKATIIWGPSFFGIPPLYFLIISIITIILFLSVRIKSPLSSTYFCKLCNVPMCRKCRFGTLCHNCIQSIKMIQDEKLRRRVESRISNKSQFKNKLIKIILSFFFPGSESIYKCDTVTSTGIMSTLATSFIYATYIVLFSINFSFPFWIFRDFFLFIFFCLLMYNGIYMIRAINAFLIIIKSTRGNNVTQR